MRDPVELEVFKNLYHSIAEEMGAALRRTSFSPNIKERRDYSCAVFDSKGQVIAMGDHMPVHLGSMPMSVAAAVEQCVLEPGDVVMLNDPFRGGTHLPDITLVMPVYLSRAFKIECGDGAPPRRGGGKPRHHTTPDFYVASRAHHADVGGTYPGSMGPCREIYQEGLRIPPVKIMRGGKLVSDVLALLLNNVRTPEEREGDLGAQIAACQTGAQRLREICDRYGIARAKHAAADLLVYSEEMMRAFLRTIPPGRYQAEDFLDDDGVENKPVRIAVTIQVKASSAKKSAVETRLAASPSASSKKPAAQVTIDFTGSDPQVQGAINAVEAITYSACFYVFRCLLREDVPATSGLMRPIGVIAPRSGEPFAYYETIAGGMGASPTKDGVSGVHTHMTNSLNTPAEALEYAYPLRVRSYSLRAGSGGDGKHRGGDGIVREIEVLTDAEVTLLADRRLRADDRIRIQTPGGGGFGSLEQLEQDD